MIPLLGKPFLEHMIYGLKEAGIDEILLIVGYRQEKIKEYFEKASHYLKVKIDYVSQDEYLGTAHAANYAKDFIKDEDFLMMYGDIFVDPEIFKLIRQKYKGNKYGGLITLIKVKNPQNYGIITLNSNNLVKSIYKRQKKEAQPASIAHSTHVGV